MSNAVEFPKPRWWTLCLPSGFHPAARGFTLLEVIVALAITLLSLGVLFRGSAESMKAVQVSGRYREALARARSHLAGIVDGVPLFPGEQAGEDGNSYRWRVRIVPIAIVSVAVGRQPTPVLPPRSVLYGVVVTISWREGTRFREVRLESRRVGAQPPAAP